MIHELKCEKQYFEAVASGKKTFEVRYNDRPFMVGDFLALNEVIVTAESYADNMPAKQCTEYTGRCCLVEVVYILDDKAGRFLQDGYVCMAIRPCDIKSLSNSINGISLRNMYEVPIYSTVAIKEETP